MSRICWTTCCTTSCATSPQKIERMESEPERSLSLQDRRVTRFGGRVTHRVARQHKLSICSVQRVFQSTHHARAHTDAHRETDLDRLPLIGLLDTLADSRQARLHSTLHRCRLKPKPDRNLQTKDQDLKRQIKPDPTIADVNNASSLN